MFVVGHEIMDTFKVDRRMLLHADVLNWLVSFVAGFIHVSRTMTPLCLENMLLFLRQSEITKSS